ncbi:replication-associated recombination protein A [bacterium]|nr:replication-associated recombination protein A [bacterium]NBX98627.1 replication-associated recombination protein A [bacterium]NDC94237.1 replication-associated recombination protein A [bacterium]NDD84004.1 replication-associated recombination protein A [bacterium]NDG29448.1 replication-associated recombination protein A [bacterium]
MSLVPLAEKMRPKSFNEMIGHESLLKNDGLLASLLTKKQIVSLILWGPAGTGKTTIARILAENSGADFIELSAVTSGLADVRKVIEHAKQNHRLAQVTVLFVDEIHRFNKAQQDAFLPYVENGVLTLIGATTENPSFEVIGPLLSRMRIVVLQKLTYNDVEQVVVRARKKLGISAARLPLGSIKTIAKLADGDARRALGILELASELTKGKIDSKIIANAAQKPLIGYDKNGEQHYNLISAFIKSLRGSDTNAALYYMARILAGGEDPKFLARRMVVFASEDIGIAASPALNIAVSSFLAVERVGMPECEYNLYHCATVLAGAQKSRAVTNAMAKAKQAATEYGNLPVPIHLRNAPTKMMKDLGYGKGYDWQADFKHAEGFLPPEISDLDLF